MQFQITTAGADALNSAQGPISLSRYALGGDYGYVPDPSATDIRGELIHTGTPSEAIPVSGNIFKYVVYLDHSIGPFQFGEVALYMSTGELFAIGVESSAIEKTQMTAQSPGSSLKLECYLTMIGNNYHMFLDTAESDNRFRLAVISGVDHLPTPSEATPNAYVVQSEAEGQTSFIAYTDRSGLWVFDAYNYGGAFQGVVASGGGLSVESATSLDDNIPLYVGHIILQFTTGPLRGVCRVINNVIAYTLNFVTPLVGSPNVGDQFILFKRSAVTTTNVPTHTSDLINDVPFLTPTTITPASASVIGGIRVGSGLSINGSGVLSTTSAAVSSVAGKTGAVTLVPTDIVGLALVARTGSYADIIGAPTPYVLPIANPGILGGVKIGSGLSITPDGTLSISDSSGIVLSVNGQSGNVTVNAATLGLASVATTGSYTSLSNRPVVATKTSELINDALFVPATQYANASDAGVIKIGPAFSVDEDGFLSIGSLVSSVAGRSGDITLVPSDIVGIGLVAITNSYLSLADRPTVPTTTSELLNTSGYLRDGETIDQIHVYVPSAGADETLVRRVLNMNFVLRTDALYSVANARVGATASTLYRVFHNDSTEIATITFEAGGSVGTFVVPSDVTFVPGDTISIKTDTSAPSGMQDLSITLYLPVDPV